MSDKVQQNLFGGDNHAVFSEDRKYRYALWRIWDTNNSKVMFIGLNPSTANENDNDPTIRRVIGFAKDWGYGGVYMMNCFPFVSSNPKDLVDYDRTPFDSYQLNINDKKLREVGGKCSEIIFAWGNFEIVKTACRDNDLRKMFPHAKCLGKNKSGSPKHPLYISAKTKPIIYG
jgi:hypothetical protein